MSLSTVVPSRARVQCVVLYTLLIAVVRCRTPEEDTVRRQNQRIARGQGQEKGLEDKVQVRGQF